MRKGDGVGPVVDLDEYCSKLLVVTLGITDVVERTGLTVSVWGSPDQTEWGAKPLLTFRQRQYCGVYSVLLNMAMHPDVRYLRVQWNMNRWGRGERTPSVRFRSIPGRIRRARQRLGGGVARPHNPDLRNVTDSRRANLTTR